MDDHVAGIDQYPIAGFLPFDGRHTPQDFLNVLPQPFGQRIYLPPRAAAGNHHEIGHRRLAEQVYGRNFLRFTVAEGLFDKVAQRDRFG